MGAYVIAVLVIRFGVVVNCIAGFCASMRREYRGGRFAVIGMALWLVPGLVLRVIR